jgi:hypothetical protein
MFVFVLQLANGHLMETLPCTFYNLKSLILWTHFCERPAILATLCLLMNAPNLEELEITVRTKNTPLHIVIFFVLLEVITAIFDAKHIFVVFQDRAYFLGWN